ncbi:MAG TPA: hypothetical protein VK797_15665 [Tepidisphaeraceae bacterium]|jgi:hypothetical protein|nr:hypothetical protein [Tepidisphaeraceae bacterium]
MVTSRRQLYGLVILNVAAVSVIAGALYDLLVPAVPPNHLRYVGALDPAAVSRFARLDLAMLRSIGGCLLAIGVTCLLLINGPVRRGNGWARLAVALLIGVAEANNAYRMYPFDSPWYAPLSFAILAVVGAALVGNRRGHGRRPIARTTVTTRDK